MKASHVLPPLTAVALVGIWNFQSWQAVHTLKDECAGLNRRISSARLSSASDDSANQEERRTPTAAFQKGMPIDWHYLLAQVRHERDVRSRLGVDERALQDLHWRIGEMSGRELEMVLDEIAALGLDPADRTLLEQEFIRPFISKEPVRLVGQCNRGRSV